MLHSVSLFSNLIHIVRKHVNWCSLFVSVLLIYLLGQYFYHNKNDLELQASSSGYLWIAMLLVPLNLFCEVIKLHYRMKNIMSFRELFAQVCKGFSYNLIVPFGAGTYAGRLWNISTAHFSEISKLTAASSLSQTFCNLILGIGLGANFCLDILTITSFEAKDLFLSVIIILIAIFIIMVLDKSNYGSIVKWRTKLCKRTNSSWRYLSTKDWCIISYWSLLRYIIYLTQCVLVLFVFGAKDIILSIQASSVYLMLMSVIWLPGSLSLFSRIAITGLVFPSIGFSIEQSNSFSVIIFMLNAMVPAMFGLIYLFKDTIQLKS